MSNSTNLNATAKILDELGLDPRLLNRLDSVEDPARLLTRRFRAQGWAVGRTPDSNELRLTSPSGTTELRQVQGKVWHHPVATEKVCKDKEVTRRLLEFADVPVPRGMAFEVEDREIADAVRPRLGHSVVVKPSNAGGSHGVTVGVTDREAFRGAWNRAASI